MSDDLRLAAGPGLRDGLVIPSEELMERFSRSSGPGGQGVNTTDSRVELSWDIAMSSVLSDAQRERLVLRLGARLVEGTVTIAASEHRSQLQNRLAARQRLATLISEGLSPPAIRRPTRPSRAAKQARLDSKRRNADIKSGRGRIRPD